MANEQERKDSLLSKIEIPAEKPPSEEENLIARAEDFILSFITAIKITQLYPETNPAIQQSLERARKKLLDFTSKEDTLTLNIKKREIIFNSKPLLAKKEDANKLALKFYLLDIQKISLSPQISGQELRDFIYLLGQKVDDIKKDGDIVSVLQKLNINNIAITLAKKVKVIKEKEGADEDIEDIEEELEPDDIKEIENKLRDFDNNINYFQDIFLSVSHVESRHRRMLLGILENPSDFADLLVDISAQAIPAEGQTKLEAQVEFIQNAINNLGEYIQELDAAEQERLFKKLAKVILSLKTELKEDLLQQKILPQLEKGSLESKILNYFPAIDLASALTSRIKLHSGASSIIYDALDNLTIPKERRNSIIELIRQKLTMEKKNIEEFDILFKDIDLLTRPSSDAKDPDRLEFPEISYEYGPQEEKNIENKVEEYKQLVNKHEVIYTLLDLLPLIDNYQSFCVVVDKLGEKMDLFVSEMELNFTLRTVTVLKNEAEKRKNISEKFSRKIERALEKLSSEEMVYKMADIAIEAEQESEEFQKIYEITNKLGTTAVRNLLKRLIIEESMTARKKIIQLLIELGKDYIDILGRNITHEKWYVARNIVHILGYYGPQALPYFKKVTRHPEFQVRKELIYALSQIKNAEATQMLISFLLEDDDKRTHELVISQLGILSAQDSIDYLLSILEQKEYLNKNPSLVLVIIKALGQIKAKAALEQLKTFTKVRWILKRFWLPVAWRIRRQANIAIKLTEKI
jgi:hypothetical protein